MWVVFCQPKGKEVWFMLRIYSKRTETALWSLESGNEITDIIAKWCDIFIGENAIKIETNHSIQITATRHTVIAFGNVVVILVRFPKDVNVSLVPRALYGLPVFFPIGFVELFLGNRSV